MQTVYGCDSIVTLNLTVLPEGAKVTNLTESACDSFTFAGKTRTVSGTYTDSLQTATGADSLVVLDLTIFPSAKTAFSKTIAYGNKYEFDGELLSQSGTYIANLQTVNGCDSIVTLNLTVLENQLPTFALLATEYSIAEHSPKGTVIVQILAADPEGAELSYTIEGDNLPFAIDATTGTVTVADGSLLNFETQREYNITVVAHDGTNSVSVSITIRLEDVVVETSTPEPQQKLVVSPNPASCCIRVECSGVVGNLTLISGNGVDVFSLAFSGSTELDVTDLPAGTYTIRLLSGELVLEEAVIVH